MGGGGGGGKNVEWLELWLWCFILLPHLCVVVPTALSWAKVKRGMISDVLGVEALAVDADGCRKVRRPAGVFSTVRAFGPETCKLVLLRTQV